MIGRVISGRYTVESLIGSGGMANVYKAHDNMLNRTVALKVLKEEHRGDMEFVRRFEREARAVLSLSHENIVRSYAVGEDGDINYIVLEYVEGSTLKELIKSDGPMSPKVAVNITCQVLDALSHAHQKGIIHRDVKPQNVIITPRGRAKLRHSEGRCGHHAHVHRIERRYGVGALYFSGAGKGRGCHRRIGHLFVRNNAL